MSVQTDVKKTLDALGADIAALQSQCASLSSQISGIKSGIDSSGTGWIRFSDGTQVCWAKINHNTRTNFPVAFSATPVGSVSASALAEQVGISEVTTTRIRAGFASGSGSGDITYNGQYIAVGRWK